MKEEYPPHVAAAIAQAERREAEAYVDAGIATRRALREGKPLPIRPAKNATAPSFVTPRAKGRIAKPRGMNRLEEAYGGVLLSRRAAGEVLWYAYEGVTLKLADDTRFTPDWAVMLKDGELQMHEVKGPHRWEDSIVKLRVAARLFPFRFFLVTREGSGWKEKEVTP